jgi:hypothetical protein
MPQMQEAVAEYRSRMLPVIFVLSQKVYAEIFRVVLGNSGITAGKRQVDVERKVAELLSASHISTAHPFPDAAAFQMWWSATFDYSKLRLARNQVVHGSYVFNGRRLSVKDENGVLLLDWTESQILSFAEEILRLSKSV